ncbi:DUF2218 domain-containing protein [Vannielia litorea]|uniref:DUF2218 domain-containing protein n=1 Tax=Vannielia TaxID=2813041 RepID=UPI001C9533A9|nr:DUF2218 domain-containing protein [Vannielia litorea]MBY6048795.1 DUF2218 domain-containing protein [Vannielia litorea]MBY6076209.1 DUF2218 domain-containing protein [Vannielia litorea]
MQEQLHDTGRFATQSASKYLQQLCKHFGHKIDVRYDASSGECALPVGPAKLRAEDDALVVEVTAPSEEGLTRARAVIDNHLVRFAFRENFETMDWEGLAAAS